MNIFNSILILTLIIIFFCRNGYIGELLISFLPYIAGGIFGIVMIWMIYCIKHIFLVNGGNIQNCKAGLLFLVLFSILCGLYTYEYFSFYQGNTFQTIDSKDTIRVMYANIYSKNEEYESLKNTVERGNPDIAIFVEFGEIHEEYLSRYLNNNLANINEYQRIRLAKGIMALTKNTIENIGVNNEELRREYGYFTTIKNQKPYYFYTIHTSSPISNYYFKLRNKQLTEVKQEIASKHQNLKDNIIVLGDFNTTPRSAYYKAFEKQFEGNLINITNNKPIKTWDFGEMVKINDKKFGMLPKLRRNLLSYLPVYCHIDQIFISKNVQIGEVKKIHIDGSDHEGFIVEIAAS